MTHPLAVCGDVIAVLLGLASYSGAFHEWVSTLAGLASLAWIALQFVLLVRRWLQSRK
jgi:hypothetical protein